MKDFRFVYFITDTAMIQQKKKKRERDETFSINLSQLFVLLRMNSHESSNYVVPFCPV